MRVKRGVRGAPYSFHFLSLITPRPNRCTGACLLHKIPRVVVAENTTFMGEEQLLSSRGVQVVVLDLGEAKAMMGGFVAANPALWHEDIGVAGSAD